MKTHTFLLPPVIHAPSKSSHMLIRMACAVVCASLVFAQCVLAIGRVYARYPNNANSPIFNLRIKNLSADVTIRDQLAVTHVDQEFANDLPARLEGFYVFQLPEGAQVNEMYLWINGVRTPYVIKKKEDAVVIYSEIVTKLMDPAILQELGSNTFQLRIYPFEPNNTRRIEIVYSQPLTYFKGSIQYTFPLDMHDYTSQPIQLVTLSIDLRSQFSLTGVETSVDQFPTAAKVTKIDSSHYTVAYGAENVAFSKDFYIKSQFAGGQPAMYSLTYRAPDSLGEQPYFGLWVTTPDTLQSDTSRPKTVTFVADVSSSMDGLRLSQLRDVMLSFIDLLRVDDRFNIVVFSTGVTSFRPDLVFGTPSARDSARDFISKLSPLGLTNIEAALQTSLSQNYTDPYRSSILFVTDGQASWGETNSDSIVARSVRWNVHEVPIYTVGVGDEADYTLLAKLAQANGGAFVRITADDSLYLKFQDLYRDVILPPLKDLAMNYGAFDAYDVHPATMPALHAGDQLLLAGRFTKVGTYPLSLNGSVEGTPFSVSANVAFADTDRSLLALARYWGALKIQSLLDIISSTGEQPELVNQVISLSMRYSVLSPYTAFLVVETASSGGTLVADGSQQPVKFSLEQNYPNPFNPTTTIRYSIPSALSGPQFVTLTIYDILGRRVRTLLAGVKAAGVYEIQWDGKDDAGRVLPSGLYFLRLCAGGEAAVRSMMLLK